MTDDAAALPFELARRAQAARLRRRRRAAATRDRGDAGGRDDPPRQSPTQRRGSDYEARALALLARAGLRPLAANLRCRGGEIDLAMRDGDTLVLVEVRARGDRRFGGAAASVDGPKQARLIRAAHRLLPGLSARHWPGRAPRVRFDVVAFDDERATWLRHAFEAPPGP